MIDLDKIETNITNALKKETKRSWDIFMSTVGGNNYPRKRTSRKELVRLLNRISK